MGVSWASSFHLGVPWGTLGFNLEALGGQGRHIGGIWEAYERHMGGRGRQKGGKREPNAKFMMEN